MMHHANKHKNDFSPPVQSSDCRRPTSTSKQLVYKLRTNTARIATRRDAELNEKSTHPWPSRSIHGCYVSTSPEGSVTKEISYTVCRNPN